MKYYKIEVKRKGKEELLLPYLFPVQGTDTIKRLKQLKVNEIDYSKRYKFQLNYGIENEEDSHELDYSLNDFISKPLGISPYLIAVSERCKLLFDLFNLFQSNFYEVELHFGENIYKYFLLHHLTMVDSDLIDYKSSIFTNFNFRDKSLIGSNDFVAKDVNNLKALISDYIPTYLIGPKKLTLKEEYKNIDFLNISIYGRMVSERLMNAIEEANLTGIEFQPVENLIIE